MESHETSAEEKRKRRQIDATAELLTSEFTHRANLIRMIEISRNPEFRTQFPANGALLTNLDVIVDKTEAMIKKIYLDTPWENPPPDTKTSSNILATDYADNPAALENFIRSIPKIATAQIECTMLANLYKANKDIDYEQKLQSDFETKQAKDLWEREKKAPPQTITNDFLTQFNPILFTQRFPRYLLTLNEVEKYVDPKDTETLTCVKKAIENIRELTQASNILVGCLPIMSKQNRDAMITLFKNWDQHDQPAELKSLIQVNATVLYTSDAAITDAELRTLTKLWEQPVNKEKLKSLAQIMDKVQKINDPDIKAAAKKAHLHILKSGLTSKKIGVLTRLLKRLDIISTALNDYARFLQPETSNAIMSLLQETDKIAIRKYIGFIAKSINAINEMTDPMMKMAAIKVLELAIMTRQSADPANDKACIQPVCAAGPALAVLDQFAHGINEAHTACAQKFLSCLPKALQSESLASKYMATDDDPRNQFYQANTSDIINKPVREILLLTASDPLAKERLKSALGKLANHEVINKLDESTNPAVKKLAAFLQLINHLPDAAVNNEHIQSLFNNPIPMIELLQNALAPTPKTPLTPQPPRHAVSDTTIRSELQRSASIAALFSNRDNKAQKIIEKSAPEIWEIMQQKRARPDKSFTK